MNALIVLLATALPLASPAKPKEEPAPAAAAPAKAAEPAGPSPELQRALDERVQLVNSTMRLSAAQAAKFWPVYQQFQDGFVEAYGLVELPTDPSALDDAAAGKLAIAILDRDAKVTANRAKWFPEFQKALGGKQAAGFMALDRRLWLEAQAKAAAPKAAPAAAPTAMAAPGAMQGAPPPQQQQYAPQQQQYAPPQQQYAPPQQQQYAPPPQQQYAPPQQQQYAPPPQQQYAPPAAASPAAPPPAQPVRN
jgi:hypothetical protein